MNEINWSEIYEGGKCPDCGDVIPTEKLGGDSCDNCGHVFFTFSESEA
jgi:uncharacterized OB-fold protein